LISSLLIQYLLLYIYDYGDVNSISSTFVIMLINATIGLECNTNINASFSKQYNKVGISLF